VNQDGFSTFFAVDRAWGSLRLNAERFEIELGAGQLAVREVVLNGRPVALPGEAVVVPGQPLTVPLRRQSADS